MQEKSLDVFMRDAGEKRWVDLIDTKMRRLSSKKLQLAMHWEFSQLMRAVNGETIDYEKIDEEGAQTKALMVSIVNHIELNGESVQWWTCKKSFDEVILPQANNQQIFRQEFTLDHAYKILPHISYALFEAVTNGLAMFASDQRAFRKILGIRKGFFG